MGNFGVVAIEPVKVIPEVGLETWELQELVLVACLLRVLKEFIVMLVIRLLMVVISWLAFKSVNLCLWVGLHTTEGRVRFASLTFNLVKYGPLLTAAASFAVCSQ